MSYFQANGKEGNVELGSFLFVPAVSQLSSAQNNHVKVTYFGVACSDPLQKQKSMASSALRRKEGTDCVFLPQRLETKTEVRVLALKSH